MERLRVAQVAAFLHPHGGGVESHVEGISGELARRGHHVEVVTALLDGTPVSEARDGYLVRRVPQRMNLFTTPVTPGIAQALDEAKPDLVHAHSPPPLSSWFAAKWATRRGVPFVLPFHS